MEKILNYNCDGLCCCRYCSERYTNFIYKNFCGMEVCLAFCKEHAEQLIMKYGI